MPDDVEHGYDLDAPYRQGDPLEMRDAREAGRRSSQLRRDAEKELRKRATDRAKKEGTYRRALAERIVVEKADHGVSAAKELAHRDPAVEKALVEYKVAEGLYDAQRERLRTLEGERSVLKSLIDWSATIAMVLRQTSGESERR